MKETWRWFGPDDPVTLATRDDVDVFVELVGGSDGPALALARKALGGGKGLVTANKAMIATHGFELAQAAETSGAALLFEAAVCAGTPILQTMRDGLSANRIDRIEGILNGTSNYILSAMERSGEDFAETLAEAQRLGYAEADPALDVDGGHRDVHGRRAHQGRARARRADRPAARARHGRHLVHAAREFPRELRVGHQAS